MRDRIEIDQKQVERLRLDGKSWPEIAEIVGCSLTTIKRRSKKWGLIESATEAVEEAASRATRVAKAKWTLRRAEEADLAGLAAQAARRRLTDILATAGAPLFDDKGNLVAVDNGVALAAFRLARTYEILVKNAQLLSGGATERTESLDDDAFDAEYRKLIAELERTADPIPAGGDD